MAQADDADPEQLLKIAIQWNAQDFAMVAGVIHAIQWLQVLAVPRIFHNMTRTPSREHLLGVVDLFLAYVRRGGRDTHPEFHPVPYELREPLALRLRELLVLWTPPELPAVDAPGR